MGNETETAFQQKKALASESLKLTQLRTPVQVGTAAAAALAGPSCPRRIGLVKSGELLSDKNMHAKLLPPTGARGRMEQEYQEWARLQGVADVVELRDGQSFSRGLVFD